MRYKAIHILLFLVFLSLMGYAAGIDARTAEAATGAEARITDINIMDNAVEISIDGDFTYTAYKPSDPFTVAVDLPDVDKGSFAGKLSSDKAGISEVMVTGTEEPNAASKLEILLVSPSEIEAVRSEGALLIKLKDAPMVAQADTMADESPTPTRMSMQSNLPAARNITGVDFDYSDGSLKLVIQGDGAMAADVYSLNGRIVVDVPNVGMQAQMPAAVVAPVKSIRQGPHDGGVRLVVDLQKAVEFNASTVDDKVVIELPAEEVLEILTPEQAPEAAAAAAEEGAAPEGAQYTGKIISLDFQNADIVPIFRFIGDISGYNVVVHPSVSGTVTLKLMNVPWDQALDIILNIYSLEKQIEGNIMTIAPSSVFDKIAKDKALRKKTDEVTVDLVRKTIHLDHIDVADMKQELEDRKVISPRGTITPDPKANDLWVEDTPDVLAKVTELVKHFDRPMYGKQQILVEAKIVTITSSYEREIGITWNLGVGAKILGTPIAGDFSVNNPLGLQTGTAGSPLNIPSPLAGSVISGSSPYATLNIWLDAFETLGHAKTLSNPRVLTINGQSANIQSGTQIPVSTTSAEGSTTEFVNANLALTVTPNIKPNDMIELDVQVNKDEPTAVGGATGIDTNSIKTTARVKDGETLVLGGIYVNDMENPKSGVPGLRKIPILGWLFGKDRYSESSTELLILITPRVIKD